MRKWVTFWLVIGWPFFYPMWRRLRAQNRATCATLADAFGGEYAYDWMRKQPLSYWELIDK